jgi:CHAD domain-containing protein
LEKFAQKQQDPALQPGISRLTLRLRQKRQTLQPPLEQAVERLAHDGTVAGLRAALEPHAALAEQGSPFSHRLYQHAFQHISSRLDDFLGYAEIVHLPEKVAELHEMRIAAKWLRYTMENFSSLYGGELKDWLTPVREMQEQLGDIHDCDVWGEYLPRFMEKERQRTYAYLGHIKSYKRLTVGLEGFLADRLALREQRYQDFVAFWDARLAENLWATLRSQLALPLSKAPVWPPAAPLVVDQVSA